MKQFAIVKEDGQVISVVSPGRDSDYYDGQDLGNNLTAYEISSQLDQATFLHNNYRKNGEWKTKPPRPGEYYFWNLEAENWIFDSNTPYSILREERDGRLFRSDWTQLSDAPLTESKKQEWSVYRQELRDLPQTYPNLTSLEEVIWPQEPSNS